MAIGAAAESSVGDMDPMSLVEEALQETGGSKGIPDEEPDDGNDDDLEAPEAAEDEDLEVGASDELEDADEEESDPSKEVIEVTGKDGRKKITIDYNDKKSIKRAFEQAAGVEKLYGRYVDLRSTLETEAKAKEEAVAAKEAAEARASALDTILERDGIEGVIEAALEGKSAVQVAKEILQRASETEKMSPAEKAAYAAKHDLSKKDKEVESLREQLKALENKMNSSVETAKLSQMQAAVDSVFPTFSFAGKLGNPVQEAKLDNFIFSDMQKELDKLEGTGVTITPEVVRSVLKDVASVIPGIVHQEARKLATKSKDRVSKAATKAVQSAAIKGAKASSKAAPADFDWNDTGSVADLVFAKMSKR